MKTGFSKLTRLALALGLSAWAVGPPVAAQDAPQLEIALYPGIRVTGEVGTTYVIESTTDVEGGFWLTRGWLELTTPTAMWMDSVPTDSLRRVYRAVKVTKPVAQTVANMVWIPPGRFVIGSPENERGRDDDREGPQTRVSLTKAFWMGKYEVTQREYLAVMGSNPSFYQPEMGFPEDLDRPVERVSWDDAVAYCQKLTEQERTAGRLPTGYVYRLPTEAEWEYACRAGTTTRFSFGDALECEDGCEYCALLDSHMWWYINGGPGRVGQKLPNPWGLHDLHGNVMEWCQDWFDHYPGGMVVDPQGPTTGERCVFRGGYRWSVFDVRLGCVRSCRSAGRAYANPGSRFAHCGFRAVLAPGQ
jgi:formylglycine-generating enzyme required for sulfatase activity